MCNSYLQSCFAVEMGDHPVPEDVKGQVHRAGSVLLGQRFLTPNVVEVMGEREVQHRVGFAIFNQVRVVLNVYLSVLLS